VVPPLKQEQQRVAVTPGNTCAAYVYSPGVVRRFHAAALHVRPAAAAAAPPPLLVVVLLYSQFGD